ncbi:MAG TPA: hypothetical protein VHL58_05690 [Thermoanaerobaculia bacterium]|nr:hypothetical protein [Thermoanaerobaculia bacterium]
MSLKVFHLVFIAASVLLSFGVGVWELRFYTVTRSASELSMAVLFLVMGAVLVGYGLHTFQKFKEMR